jgi:RHS repeat-associated protein/uncharacterized repeat protein (TIGR01451 family)
MSHTLRSTASGLVHLVVAVSILLGSVAPPAHAAGEGPGRAISDEERAVDASVAASEPAPMGPHMLPEEAWSAEAALRSTDGVSETVYLPAAFQEWNAGPRADVALRMIVHPLVAFPGEVVTYTLQASNVGELPMEDALLVDDLPDELVLVDAGGASYDPVERHVRWYIGQMEPDQTAQLTVRARVAESTPMGLVENQASFTGQYTPQETGASPRPLVAANATAVIRVGGRAGKSITTEGGSVEFPDGSVALQFPAGAVSETVLVEMRTLRELPADMPLPIWYEGLGLDVSLATAEGGSPVASTLQPVTVVIELADLAELGNEASQLLLGLYHYDEETGQWEELESEVLLESGLLAATTTGFSASAVASGSGSKLGDYAQPNVPTVEPTPDLFTGAAGFSYPIGVPPGRGGVEPQLALGYSSGVVDGLRGKNNPQTSWVGAGWNLDLGYIARKIQPDPNGVPEIVDEYTLVLNGVSSELVRLPDGTYRTEDDRFWRIEKRGTSGNRGGDYWVVYTKDGTEYRFGRTDETYGSGTSNSAWWMVATGEGWGGPGQDELRIVNWRWNLDRVQDTHGNEMRLDYAREANDYVFLWYGDAYIFSRERVHLDRLGAEGYCYVPLPGGGQALLWCHDCMSGAQNAPASGYTRGGYLAQITYTYHDAAQPAYRITFETEAREDYPSKQDSRNRTQLVQTFFSTRRLKEIRIEALDGGLLTTYVLDYYSYDKTESRASVLRSVQQYGADGGALPATEYDYRVTGTPSYAGDDRPQRKAYLDSVDNGYGGSSSLQYEGILGPSESGKRWYRYRVTQITADPGMGLSARTDYQYLNESENTTSYGTWDGYEFRGHPRVRVKRFDAGTLVGYSDYYFHQGDHGVSVCGREVADREGMEGRTYRVVQYDGGGGELARSETAHLYSGLAKHPDEDGDHYFIAVEATCQYAEPGSGASTRTEYEYDAYGNVVQAREYESAGFSTPYRSTVTDYVANESAWIVDRPSQVSVYAGEAEGHAVSAALNYYDRDGGGNVRDHGALPVRGDLVQVMRVDLEGGENPKTQSWYDERGNVVRTEDPLGNETTIDYDARYEQFPVESCNALHQCSYTERYGVNASAACIGSGTYFGAVCRVYGPNGVDAATRVTYDQFGRPLTAVRPGDTAELPTSEYEYFDGPYPSVKVSLREESGEVGTLVSYEYYDGFGRAVQGRGEGDTEGEWVVSSTEYDGLGRSWRSYLPRLEDGSERTPPSGDHSTASYDALGRTIRVDNPDGSRAETAYYGWTTTSIDANRHQVVHRSDAFGRVTHVTEYTGTVESGVTVYATSDYWYDVLDNLTAVEDAAGNLTEIRYDGLGRKVRMDDPDMGSWYYHYDLAGNLIAQVDAKLQAINFYYDPLYRLVGKTYEAGPVVDGAGYGRPVDGGPYTVGYSYDAYDPHGGQYGRGLRTGMTYPAGSASYRYDERGRVVEEERAFEGLAGSYVTGFEYDALDRVVTMTYPDGSLEQGDGEEVTPAYSARGLPDTLASEPGKADESVMVAGTAYNASGQVTQLSLGSGLSTAYDYHDQNLRLEELRVAADDEAGSLLWLEYGYDEGGNVLSITDHSNSGQVQMFRYDPLDRLTSAWTDGKGEGQFDRSWVYDEIGNIDRRVKEGAIVDYSYAGAAPHAVTNLSDGARFEYDDNGNMTLRVEISGTGVITYVQSFDIENRLARVVRDPGSEEYEFRYDGDGERVVRLSPEGTTIYVGEHFEEYFPGEEWELGEPTPDGTASLSVLAILMARAVGSRMAKSCAGLDRGVAEWPSETSVGGPALSPENPAQVGALSTSATMGDEAAAAPLPAAASGRGLGLAPLLASAPAGRLRSVEPLAAVPCSASASQSESQNRSPVQGSQMMVAAGGYYQFTWTSTGAVEADVYYQIGTSPREFMGELHNSGESVTHVYGYIPAGTEITMWLHPTLRHSTLCTVGGDCCTTDNCPTWFDSEGWHAHVYGAGADEWDIDWNGYHPDDADHPDNCKLCDGEGNRVGCVYGTVECCWAMYLSCANLNTWDEFKTEIRRYTPAQAELDSPANGSWQTGDVDFEWTGVPAGARPILGYQIEITDGSGTARHDTDTAPFYHDYLNLEPYDEVQWRARARDSYGWGPWSATWSLQIDNAAPPNPSTATEVACGGSVVSGEWQSHCADPSFTWSAEEPDGQSGVASFQVYWGGNPDGTSTATVAAPGGEGTYDPPAVGGSGAYYLRVRSIDAAGNIADDWATLFEFRYDPDGPTNPQRPADPNCAHTDPEEADGNWQSTCQQPQFTWQPGVDQGSGVGGYHVYWGPLSGGTDTLAVVSPAFTVPVPVTSGSTNYLRVQTFDEAGNEAEWTTLFELKYDPTAPVCDVAAEVEGDEIELDWWAWDDVGLSGCELAVRVDGGTPVTLTTECAGTMAYADTLAGHDYAFHLVATDVASNALEDTAELTYHGTPPEVEVTAVRMGEVTSLTWSASDLHSALSTCTLEVEDSAGSWNEVSTNCSGEASWEGAEPGFLHTFRLRATDAHGNEGSAEDQAGIPGVRKYYYHGGQRVAMRSWDEVYYLHGDHLGSTTLTTDGSGAVVARQLYHPYGTLRYEYGEGMTDFGFTGQRRDGTGLIYMHARYYDPYLNRFVSADAIVPNPGSPQAWNRYSYVENNPVRHTDASGHGADVPPLPGVTISASQVGTTSSQTIQCEATVSYQIGPEGSQCTGWCPGRMSAPVYWTSNLRVMTTSEFLDWNERVRQGRIGALILGTIDLINAVGAAYGTWAAAGNTYPVKGTVNDPSAQEVGAAAGTSGTGQPLPVAPLWIGVPFRLSREGEFTARNFRHNLSLISRMPTDGRYDAHHMLAQAPASNTGVQAALDAAGVSLHDPRWGAWWQASPEGTHQNLARQYNRDWDLWLQDNPTPTFYQLVTQAEAMADQYGLSWSGDAFYTTNQLP